MTSGARPTPLDAREKAARSDSGVGASVAKTFGLTFSFGPFHLLPTQRLLLEGDQPVRLGSRALDILLALVERPGELVSKRELMARVWPDLVVVEANLTVHVASLRRALRDGRARNRYLINIPGQGYSFVAPVIVMDDSTTFSANHTSRTGRPNSLAQTTLMMDGFDISRVDNSLQVLIAIASALGFDIRAENTTASLNEKQIRVVLDSGAKVIVQPAAFAD